MGRKPRNYEGNQLTSKKLRDILPSTLSLMKKAYVSNFDSFLTVWPNLVGPQVSSSATPVAFRDGILTVVVKNSTLYSLLVRNEKGRITKQLQRQFPKSQLRDIVFRLG